MLLWKGELVSHETQLADSQSCMRNLIRQLQDATSDEQVNTEEANVEVEKIRQFRDFLHSQLSEQRSDVEEKSARYVEFEESELLLRQELEPAKLMSQIPNACPSWVEIGTVREAHQKVKGDIASVSHAHGFPPV